MRENTFTVEFIFNSYCGLVFCSHECFRPLATSIDGLLATFRFFVPPETDYMLASNDLYRLKYRKSGGIIHIFISNSNL